MSSLFKTMLMFRYSLLSDVTILHSILNQSFFFTVADIASPLRPITLNKARNTVASVCLAIQQDLS